jgi:hypothetical protein
MESLIFLNQLYLFCVAIIKCANSFSRIAYEVLTIKLKLYIKYIIQVLLLTFCSLQLSAKIHIIFSNQ